MARLESAYNGVSFADFASGGVDDVGASFHFSDELVVEKMFGAGVERVLKSGLLGMHVGIKLSVNNDVGSHTRLLIK